MSAITTTWLPVKASLYGMQGTRVPPTSYLETGLAITFKFREALNNSNFVMPDYKDVGDKFLAEGICI
jgi:hypothetical protein